MNYHGIARNDFGRMVFMHLEFTPAYQMAKYRTGLTELMLSPEYGELSIEKQTAIRQEYQKVREWIKNNGL